MNEKLSLSQSKHYSKLGQHVEALHCIRKSLGEQNMNCSSMLDIINE